MAVMAGAEVPAGEIEAAGGGTVSFREFVERQMRNVYNFAYNLTGNHHDAEDLSQEVFMKAYQSHAFFRGDAKPSTWLYRIAVNALIDMRRRKSFTHWAFWRKHHEDVEQDELANVPDFAIQADPEHVARASGLRRDLLRAMEKLSPRERAVFVMRHDEDCTFKEIAGALGVAEGTVKQLHFRAVRKLQKLLAHHHAGGGSGQ